MNKILNETDSRRSFFTRSAVLFGASALAAKVINAQTSVTPPTTAQTDLNVLNYALSLENLEAAFYNTYVGKYTATDYSTSSYGPVFGATFNGNASGYIGNIRDHENAHVAALKSVITSLGGIPVAPCVYKFNVNNVNDFLMTAMALENTGVMAYDGAISMITNLDLRQAAATIATVEARHASFLNVLNGAIPFPSAFDTPKAMADVLAIAGQFITSCPVSTTANNPLGPKISRSQFVHHDDRPDRAVRLLAVDLGHRHGGYVQLRADLGSCWCRDGRLDYQPRFVSPRDAPGEGHLRVSTDGDGPTGQHSGRQHDHYLQVETPDRSPDQTDNSQRPRSGGVADVLESTLHYAQQTN